MENSSFTVTQNNIKNFSHIELKRLKHQVDAQLSKDRVRQTIAERESTISSCSHCKGKSFIRCDVTRQGHQRYRCKSCKKTFSSLTGILWWLKMCLIRWLTNYF
ncbi:transposase [Psychromonas marina]|uniref:transposase n=1 Tax=Psychromonas marina TaxID=88364 RepID=UPI003D67CF31